MARAKTHHFIALGPAIPLVPVTHFDRMRLTPQQWMDVWSICGPSVERNMALPIRQRLELWQIIAAAYLEGLHHGAGARAEEPA